ncbi:hypothetical protein NC651_016843 [Populus alba x Populus x berolinensis]|nr:hypothetical protein NC651_016843 [Populus alba x Populus x berolinensis]
MKSACNERQKLGTDSMNVESDQLPSFALKATTFTFHCSGQKIVSLKTTKSFAGRSTRTQVFVLKSRTLQLPRTRH